LFFKTLSWLQKQCSIIIIIIIKLWFNNLEAIKEKVKRIIDLRKSCKNFILKINKVDILFSIKIHEHIFSI